MFDDDDVWNGEHNISLSADLAEVGAACEQLPDVGGGQLAVSADGVRQVAADLRCCG